MPYLSVNGVELKCVEAHGARNPVPVGAGSQQAYSGKTQKERKRVLRQEVNQTIPDTQVNTQFYRNLINGFGARWAFDDAVVISGVYNGQYSDDGIEATFTAGTGGATQISTAQARWGVASMLVFHGTAGVFSTATFPMPNDGQTGDVASGWTILVWRYESAAWNWYTLELQAGVAAQYKNGAYVGSTLPSWMSVSNGVLTITGSGQSADAYYDDLVILPYVVPSAFIAGQYTFASAQAWSSMPFLVASGDWLDTQTSIKVDGTDNGTTTMSGNLGGGFTDNLEQVAFTLQET